MSAAGRDIGMASLTVIAEVDLAVDTSPCAVLTLALCTLKLSDAHLRTTEIVTNLEIRTCETLTDAHLRATEIAANLMPHD